MYISPNFQSSGRTRLDVWINSHVRRAFVYIHEISYVHHGRSLLWHCMCFWLVRLFSTLKVLSRMISADAVAAIQSNLTDFCPALSAASSCSLKTPDLFIRGWFFIVFIDKTGRSYLIPGPEDQTPVIPSSNKKFTPAWWKIQCAGCEKCQLGG